MKKYGNLVATVGEYKNKDGEDKKRYMTVGVVFQDEDNPERMSIKLEALPVVPEWSGWLSIYQDKPDDSNYTSKETPSDDKPIDLASIPF